MKEDVITRINENYPSFSKGQRAIAKFISENNEKAAFMTAVKLGQAVKVSESTVVRFAAKLGFVGYPEMQKALQEMIRNSLTSVQRIDAARETISDRNLLERVLHFNIEEIRSTLETSSPEAFNACVETISGAKRIFILGMRSSAAVAAFLYYYLNLLFEDVFLLENDISGEIYGRLMRLAPDDVMISVSYPRYSTKTLEATMFAKKQGAKVVSMTDSYNSPLASLSDHVLISSNKMISFVDSLVSSMSLATALIVALSLKKEGELPGIFERLEKIWADTMVYEKKNV